MNTDTWHKILTLLTVIILADDRVYKEEVDTFVEVVIDLNSKISPEMFMTHKMAFDWFVANKDDVAKILSSPNAERHLDNLIKSLNQVKRKDAILNALQTVAHADNDFHPKEQSVIGRTIRLWKIAA